MRTRTALGAAGSLSLWAGTLPAPWGTPGSCYSCRRSCCCWLHDRMWPSAAALSETGAGRGSSASLAGTQHTWLHPHTLFPPAHTLNIIPAQGARPVFTPWPRKAAHSQLSAHGKLAEHGQESDFGCLLQASPSTGSSSATTVSKGEE